MRDALTWAVVAAFAGLAVLHFYWAFGGTFGSRAAIPEVRSVPAFRPSTAATVTVAIALIGAALTVATAGGVFPLAVPRSVPISGALLLAVVLLARAAGDFRLVGFFKSQKQGRFAELDTVLYSPACVALALAIITIVALQENRA